MKHFPIPRDIFSSPKPVQAPMTDQDWEAYARQIEREEADFINATAHLLEKPYER